MSDHSPYRKPNINVNLYYQPKWPNMIFYVTLKHWHTGRIIRRKVGARTPKGAMQQLFGYDAKHNYKEYYPIGLRWIHLDDYRRKERIKKRNQSRFLAQRAYAIALKQKQLEGSED